MATARGTRFGGTGPTTAVVKADDRGRRRLLVGLAVAFVPLVVVYVVAQVRLGLLLAVPVVVIRRARRGCFLSEVRVEGSDLVLASVDGSEQVLRIDQIGGIGIQAWIVRDRLIEGFGHAKLVIRGHRGELLTSRRAAWMSLTDLEALSRHLGVAWLREHCYGPIALVVPVPRPPGLPVSPSEPGPPEALAHLGEVRRRRRRRLLGYVGVLAVGIVAGMVVDAVPEGPIRNLVIAVAVAGWVIGVLLLLLAPLNEGRARPVARRLRKARFLPAEVVVMTADVDGLNTTDAVRTVGLFDPAASEPVSWWTIESGGAEGWLEGDQRLWAWFGWDGSSKEALLQPLDRSTTALLHQKREKAKQREAARFAHHHGCLSLLPPPPAPDQPVGWGVAPMPMAVGAPVPGSPPPGWVPPPPPPPPFPGGPSR